MKINKAIAAIGSSIASALTSKKENKPEVVKSEKAEMKVEAGKSQAPESILFSHIRTGVDSHWWTVRNTRRGNKSIARQPQHNNKAKGMKAAKLKRRKAR